MKHVYTLVLTGFLLLMVTPVFSQFKNGIRKQAGQSLSNKQAFQPHPQKQKSGQFIPFSSRLTQQEPTGVKSKDKTPVVHRFSKDNKETASTLFVNQKSRFGLSAQDEMQLIVEKKDQIGMRHFSFQQKHEGYPVEGAIYKVREKDGRLHTANGLIVSDLKVSTRIRLSEKEALQNALAHVGAEKYMWEAKGADRFAQILGKGSRNTFFPKGELVIVGPEFSSDVKEAHLTYKFDVFAAQPQLRYDVYVDVLSGRVVLMLNKMMHQNQNGTAKTRYSGDVEIVTDHFEGGYRLRETGRGLGTNIVTLNGHNMTPIDFDLVTDFVDDNNDWNNVNPAMDEIATDLHWASEMTYDYFLEKHNRNSIDDNGMDIIGVAHLGQDFFNAQWTGGWMQFGDGSGRPLTGLGIVAHEFTHGVTGNTAGLIYQGESGALNESFSDIFGVSVEFMVGKDSPENIWQLADELYDNGAMRSLSNPTEEGDPDTYGGAYWKNTAQGSADNGGVHSNSGVQNFWFYLLVEGGTGTNDNGDAYTVNAIGIEKAEKIAYRNLSYYLTPSSGFADAREGSLMAAEDLYGFGSEEYIQVVNAWYAVGVGGQFSANDLSVRTVLLPEERCELLGSNENISVILKNVGTQAIAANTPFTYSINILETQSSVEQNFTDLTLEIPNALASGETVEIDLGNTFDFSESGTYSVTVGLNTGQDEVDENNAANALIANELGGSDNDLSIAFSSFSTECNTYSANESLIVEVFNNGCSVITAGTELEMSYTLNDQTPVTETFMTAQDIASNGSVAFTFTNTLDLSANGIYSIEASVLLAADTVPANNSALISMVSGPVSTFPYEESFAANGGGWSSEALYGIDTWEWSKSDETTHGWVTNAEGNYTNDSDIVLYSPCFDFSSLALPRLSFLLEFSIEQDWDGMILEYQADGGEWNKVALEGYNNYISEGGLLSTPWFSGNGGGVFEAVMPQLAGKQQARFRFRMASDSYVNAFGAFLQEFSVRENIEYEVQIEEISTGMESGSCVSTEEPSDLRLTLLNKGSASGYTVTIGYTVSSDNGTADHNEEVIMAAGFGESETFTFSQPADFTAYGMYTVEAWVKKGTDILAEGSMTIANSEQVATLPYAEDFETEMPVSWRTSNAAGSAGWLWGDYTVLGSEFFNIPDHTNFMASNDDVCDCDMSEDRLITPTFDFSAYGGNINLAFDAFFTGDYNSMATVEYSLDGGATFETLMTLNSNADWQRIQADLSQFAGMSCVTFAFRHNDQTDWGSGFAIDNMEISNVEVIDVAVTGASNAYDDSCLGQEEISVSIANEGTEGVSSMEVSYSVTLVSTGNVVASATETISELLGVGQEIPYTFAATADLSATGEYSIEVSVAATGDANSANDLMTVGFEHLAPVSVFPYTQTFDNATALDNAVEGWFSHLDEPVLWEARTGTPFGIFPTADHTSGTGNLMFSYLADNLNRSVLESRCFDLTSNSNTVLEFYYSMYSSGGAHLRVHVLNLDNQELHEDVWTAGGEERYDDAWNKAELGLTGYGDNIKVFFEHELTMDYSVVTIDDISLQDGTLKATALTITGPATGCDETLSVLVKNNGTYDFTAGELTLSYMINEEPVVSEQLSTALAAGETLEYTFTQQAVFETGVSYDISVMITDNNTMDNSASGKYTKQDLSALQLFEQETIYTFEGNTILLNPAVAFRAFNMENKVVVEWSDNYEGEWRTVTQSGDYTATVHVAGACSYTETVTVVMDPTTATLESVESCDETVLSPGTFVEYLWQDGSTGATFTATENGSYYVTVKDAYNRSQTLSSDVEINFTPEVPVVSFSGPAEFCDGGEVTLTAPASHAYLWSTGQTTQSITVNESGTYYVTVSNEIACSTISEGTTVNVNDLPTVEVSLSGAAEFCKGGSVTLTATEAYAYQWSTGETTQSITASETGNYFVSVYTEQGCTVTSETVNVLVDELPTAVITLDGSTLTASAGISYQWYQNDVLIEGATAQTYEAEENGFYSVDVFNAKGCNMRSEQVEYIILSADGALENTFSTYPNPSNGTFTLRLGKVNASVVQVSIVDLSGKSVYEKQVTKGNGEATINAQLKGGIYILVMKSDSGIQKQKLIIE